MLESYVNESETCSQFLSLYSENYSLIMSYDASSHDLWKVFFVAQFPSSVL